MRMGTRDKAVVQRVSLPSSRTETWRKLPGSPARLCARFLARVSWCPGCVGGPGLWPCCVVCLVSSSGSVSFLFLERGHDPGHRPKDRSSGRYPQVRTIYLDVGPAIGYLFIHFPYRFFLRLFLCTPSSRFRPTGRGLWKSLHVQSGLSVGVAPLYVSIVLPLKRGPR